MENMHGNRKNTHDKDRKRTANIHFPVVIYDVQQTHIKFWKKQTHIEFWKKETHIEFWKKETHIEIRVLPYFLIKK
jgi:hypothetical protein